MDTAPPGPDVSKAPLLVGITTFLHVISLSLFGGRIYTRVRPTLRLGWDDYFIAAAVLFDLLEWILLLIGVGHGVGRHNYYVSPEETVQAEKFLFISQPPYAWSLACAKISIALMLMRIQRDRRPWIVFLSFMILFSVLIAITMNSFQFSICRPLSAIWDHTTPGAKCLDPSIAQASIYVTASLTILTDVILSLAPVAFIVNIQRPLREKLALGFVMSLGIVASAASIAKTTLVRTYGITGDDLMDSVDLTILSILEVQLAIMASCVPCLKNVIEKMLRRIGIITTQPSKLRSGYLRQHDSTAYPLKTHKSINRTAQKTAQNDTDSVESATPLHKSRSPVNAGFKTAIEAVESLPVSHTGEDAARRSKGICLQTTVSIRSSSNASVNNVAV